LSVAMDLLSIS